ncbi:cytochrome P450 9b2-like [Uranotaenia lowii]|uniref:cytochrome P450 9b2-like n=1 Tax=Uranotaenia lowii TaxID=190385 RepID=UPI002479F713|nr:cytochrome P450 9b2-like [Uranotaenia lowii]
MVFWALVIVVALVVTVYRWYTASFDYFEKNGIPFVKPFPQLWALLAKTMHVNEASALGYDQFREHRVSGMFSFRQPGYLVHDPELVKEITIKHFDHFTEHAHTCPVDVDPLLGRALFFMDGQRWKAGRTGLSPAFTGSKMRNMYGLLYGCIEGAMKRLLEDAKGQSMEKEFRDLTSRIGNDVITSISFGVEIDSVHNLNNEFYVRGKELAVTDGFQGLKILLLALVPPTFFRIFGLRVLPKETTNFYFDLVSKSIQHREKYGINRPDFITLMLQARKNELNEDKQEDESAQDAGFSTAQEHLQSSTETGYYTDEDIAGVTGSFFFGGIETTTTVICFALYEMSLNPDIQRKLHEEIESTQNQMDKSDKLSYETLLKLKYLDMVVSETLRKWPPLGVTNRVCVKPYTLTDYNGAKITVERGQTLQIPIASIHRDVKYYPDPYRFDPERFSEENRHKINQAAFLPFGSGPRNCIGSRLALMQVKCYLYLLLSNFRVEMSQKTDVPIKLDKGALTYHATNGFWFHLIPKV